MKPKFGNKSYKEDYERALRGSDCSDKKAALDAGRKYYSTLRPNSVPTILDEQTISNDINTMK
ncbi:MAG: hypothetical protein Q8L07_14600 [Sediminibacterium sp.]|nr:hypothetical protein [Sediminibacterium sp.]